MKKQLFTFLLILSGLMKAQVHVGPSQTYTNIGAASNARAIHAGDTVYIHAGTYPGAMSIDSLVGDASHWITIRPYQNDSVSILGQWTVTRTHYTLFTGLTFNGNDSASWANGSIYHQLFFNYNYVCYNDLSNIIVDSCQFMNLLTGPNKYTNVNTSGNVSVKFTGTDTFQITNCIFQGNAGSEGLSMNSDRNGLVQHNRFNAPAPGFNSGWASHCKGGSSLITIEQNIYINWPAGGMDIGGETGASFFCPLKDSSIYEADSISFYSNILIGGQTCIRLASLSNSNIINNTCFKSNDFTVRFLVENPNVQFTNNHIYNNIFTIVNTILGFNEFYINETSAVNYTTFDLTNDLFFSYSDTTMGLSGIVQDVGNVNPAIISGALFSNPMFNDTALMDFSLEKGSTAIGAGLNVSSPVFDFNGNRFNSKKRSIGAIEYNGMSGINKVENAGDLSVYPNPTDDIFTMQIAYSHQPITIGQIEIYNVFGKSMPLNLLSLTHSELRQVLYKIDISNFPNGIYLLRANTKDGILLKQLKIVKCN
jgi:hypothetical protein